MGVSKVVQDNYAVNTQELLHEGTFEYEEWFASHNWDLEADTLTRVSARYKSTQPPHRALADEYTLVKALR